MTPRPPLSGSCALRRGRCSEAGRAYLVTAATRGRERCFAGFGHGRLLAKLLDDRETWRGSDVEAWVVMPDHVHVLLVLGVEVALSQLLNRAMGRMAFGFNRATGRSGALWQGGFHDRAIRASEDVRDVARYIVANPLRAGLVDDIGNYPFWNSRWVCLEEMVPR